jgi:hypothetical protein
MAPPRAGLIEHHFMELAGHRGMLDAAASKKLDGPAQAAPTDPLKILADIAELRVGMIGHAQTTYVVILAAKCFGHQ